MVLSNKENLLWYGLEQNCFCLRRLLLIVVYPFLVRPDKLLMFLPAKCHFGSLKEKLKNSVVKHVKHAIHCILNFLCMQCFLQKLL